MDLGDFIPESYTVHFVIGECQYDFDFAEATVFEVLQLMAGQMNQGDIIAQAHSIILPFLKAHLTEGDAEKLESDLKCLPYRGESLDLERILDAPR
jgi:hypothetical protein